MTTPTVTPAATTADVLRAAADLLDANGLYREGDFWPGAYTTPWRPGLPLEPVAAVAVAQGVTSYRELIARMTTASVQPVRHWPALDPAVAALAEYLGFTGSTAEALARLWVWSDHQSAAGVADAMRGCATIKSAGVPA